MTKILKLSLLFLLIFQLWTAFSFELAHDEAYYWLYSHHSDWGYFDHPPVVGLVIKFFSFLPHSEISVRLGFILMQLFAAYLIMLMVPKERKGTALALFFAFPLASFSGVLALPDLPLLFMTTLYCFFLKQYLENKDSRSILGLSLVIPLLLYSKYHGILVVFFTVLAIPQLLRRKDFYLITLISIVLFFPHVWWQYKHEFSTLKYHFFERPKVDFSFKRLLEYSATQIFLAGLFVGPVVWWITTKFKSQNEFQRALKFICIGTFCFFLFSTISKKFEANWTIFLTAPLILLAVSSQLWERKWVKNLLIASLIPVLLGRVLFAFDPADIKIRRLQEFHGWKDWAKEIDEKCAEPILANTYQIASKLSFYLNQPIHALNYHSRKNQFDYWPMNKDYYLTPDVCYITDKKEFSGEIIYSPEGKKLYLIHGFKPSEFKADSP